MIKSTDGDTQTTWELSGRGRSDEPVWTVPIDASPFTVGRRSDQMLSLASATVSSRHAELRLNGGELSVQDLGSRNGTFVNGERISAASPVRHGDLVQFAQVVFRAGCADERSHYKTIHDDSADRALSLIQFDKLVTDRAVVPHYQPIVDLPSGELLGYEALGRSRLFGLNDPGSMFGAAEVLNLEGELSRMLREVAVRQSDALSERSVLFLNTHPTEVADPALLERSLRTLREAAPTRPLVLEIHEATATQAGPMRELRALLDGLDIGLAYDDFGSGQARLVELVDVPPDYLKFDIALVENVSRASNERRQMLERLVQMTRELGIVPLAEGVSSPADHEVCCEVGFRSAQGYLYGRPATAKAFAP